MKIVTTAASMLMLGTFAAHAGGIERTPQSVVALFEQGRYGEFSFSRVSPNVSGVGGLVTPGISSGDMAPDYNTFSFAYKADINESWSYAIIYDQPYGTDVDYPTGTGYFAQGSTAELDSNALTAILQYNFPSNVSVYGGVRYQTISADAFIPFASPIPGVTAPYDVSGERDGEFGYLVGASYERPEIALRVSLTYNSSIDHSLATTENSVIGVDQKSQTKIESPESVNLEFQSGVAKDTLVFGSVRWVNWSDFEISPADYILITGGTPLAFFADDRTTLTLGVGHKLSDKWSVAASVRYERSTGSPTGNLGPTDGLLGLTLSAIYTMDKMKITGGISYTDIGNADTIVGTAVPGGVFKDNDAVAIGFRVGYYF